MKTFFCNCNINYSSKGQHLMSNKKDKDRFENGMEDARLLRQQAKGLRDSNDIEKTVAPLDLSAKVAAAVEFTRLKNEILAGTST